MNALEEIIFHSLQRFDKIDADDLQTHVYEYLREKLVPGALGGVSGKISVESPVFTYNATTERYILNGDFHWLSGTGQFLVAESGIEMDALAARTYFQNFLTANGNLDGADTWYVWAQPDESEEQIETREFFSPIDNAAETREVVTRKRIRTRLALASKSPSGSWTRVASPVFTAGQVNGQNTIFGPTWSPVTFTDYMSFGLQDIKIPGTSGLRVITFAIEEAMRRILSAGTEDPTGTPQTQPGSNPTMSLEGLTKFVKEQTYAKRGHIVLRMLPNPNWPAGGEVDFNNLTNEAPYLAPAPVEDYRRLGFEPVVIPHTYDNRRYLVPMGLTYYTTLLDEYGIGSNQLQDVNLIVQYPDNGTPNNVNDYFDPLRPDVTFTVGREDSHMAGHLITTFGVNGSWQGASDADYSTTQGGVNYQGLQCIGIFTTLCSPYNPNLDTRQTPNHHEQIVPLFIDYNRTKGLEINNTYETDIARYATPPVIEIQIIVKG